MGLVHQSGVDIKRGHQTNEAQQGPVEKMSSVKTANVQVLQERLE